jgi:hypothetical protein
LTTLDGYFKRLENKDANHIGTYVELRGTLP